LNSRQGGAANTRHLEKRWSESDKVEVRWPIGDYTFYCRSVNYVTYPGSDLSRAIGARKRLAGQDAGTGHCPRKKRGIDDIFLNGTISVLRTGWCHTYE
jgi:hypothetical protein